VGRALSLRITVLVAMLAGLVVVVAPAAGAATSEGVTVTDYVGSGLTTMTGVTLMLGGLFLALANRSALRPVPARTDRS